MSGTTVAPTLTGGALLEAVMRVQDRVTAKTIGLPRGTRAAAEDRPLVAPMPAAV